MVQRKVKEVFSVGWVFGMWYVDPAYTIRGYEQTRSGKRWLIWAIKESI
jgi:hypothetical protein